MFERYEEQNNLYIALMKRIQQQEQDIQTLRDEAQRMQEIIQHETDT
jgi:hypothetical protein